MSYFTLTIAPMEYSKKRDSIAKPPSLINPETVTATGPYNAQFAATHGCGMSRENASHV